ncbi:MAG: CPBP family intramembrane metalloprotease [Methylacidiphilales bacterium]|nr:CPBP family intramembrane metalloprotease [Candidatus Methylacidiphilales bacterium]
MKSALARSSPPGLWSTVFLLLGATRKRAVGRQKRQQELLRHRTGKKSVINWGNLGFVFAIAFMALLNLGAAFVVYTAVTSGERIETERDGKIVVDRWFLNLADQVEKDASKGSSKKVNEALLPFYSSEARTIAREYGGSETVIEKKLRAAAQNHGTRDFIGTDVASPGFTALPRVGTFPAMLGSIVLFWWVVMLVFQGEGLELDLQRRRHPMWEWLFSHPVSSGAVFLAEMLSPIAANPIYWGAPLFVGFLYGFIYGSGLGLLAGLLIGIPISVAAACLGKALEIGAILRFSPRTRGAMIGLMSWMGYASMMLFIVCSFTMAKIVSAVGRFLEPLAIIPWPWLGLFLGETSSGSFSFLLGMLVCWLVAGLTITGSVWFSIWGAQQGLSGNFGRADSAPSTGKNQSIRFGKEPLYRKEFLWFIRDRSAIVQTILVPLTVASFQLFNMRGLLMEAQSSWNFLCGAGILFGTYFLWILGPKSLASEGAALWIALTWPRGLESLLKAKAWLWSLISTGIVSLVLIYTAFLYPESIWKITLVGIGWWFFGRSMAEKTVTLVSVPSSSGEAEKIPMGRRWAAQLGMLTFSIGILTQQWHIAIMGIVYSYVTAAAMWENFRARLPYLYDVWSEKLPPAPTLMHAMIAISILVESGAVLTGIALVPVGRANIATVQVVIYGLCAIIVSLGVWKFLSNRGVSARDVWCWPQTQNPRTSKPWWCGDGTRGASFFLSLMTGLVGGLVLGLIALGYLAILHHIPYTAELMHKSQEQMAKLPGLRTGYTIIAVAFAPFAEEYLFRGLLFRALDREWGGWRAILGSAAFFAIFHPPLSWLPVGLLGITNALVFKNTGRLAPAVILHMVYNTVVLS